MGVQRPRVLDRGHGSVVGTKTEGATVEVDGLQPQLTKEALHTHPLPVRAR
jgi:hypothetical protein